MENERITRIFEYIKDLFPNPKCELNYVTEIDLLVAIILSAQCTDKRVNQVTKRLFQKYKTLDDYANADLAAFEKEIYSTGFYHNKARNIISLCQRLRDNHGGVIPNEVGILEKLPGIGRKTASVYVAEFHKKPALAVDTHVIRVSNRLEFSESKNPTIIERDLTKIFDEENWAEYHLLMELFGRYYCTAKNPSCEGCKLKEKNLCFWIR